MSSRPENDSSASSHIGGAPSGGSKRYDDALHPPSFSSGGAPDNLSPGGNPYEIVHPDHSEPAPGIGKLVDPEALPGGNPLRGEGGKVPGGPARAGGALEVFNSNEPGRDQGQGEARTAKGNLRRDAEKSEAASGDGVIIPPTDRTAQGDDEERDPGKLLAEAQAIAKRKMKDDKEIGRASHREDRPQSVARNMELGYALIVLQKLESPDAVFDAESIAAAMITRDLIVEGNAEFTNRDAQSGFAKIQGVREEDYERLTAAVRADTAADYEIVVDSGIFEEELQEILLVHREAKKIAKANNIPVERIYEDEDDTLYKRAFQEVYGSLDRFIDIKREHIAGRNYHDLHINDRRIQYVKDRKREGDRRNEYELIEDFWSQVYLAGGEMRADVEVAMLMGGYDKMRNEQIGVGLKAQKIWGNEAVDSLPVDVREWLLGKFDEASQREIEKASDLLIERRIPNDALFRGVVRYVSSIMRTRYVGYEDDPIPIPPVSLEARLEAFTGLQDFISQGPEVIKNIGTVEDLHVFLGDIGSDIHTLMRSERHTRAIPQYRTDILGNKDQIGMTYEQATIYGDVDPTGIEVRSEKGFISISLYQYTGTNEAGYENPELVGRISNLRIDGNYLPEDFSSSDPGAVQNFANDAYALIKWFSLDYI